MFDSLVSVSSRTDVILSIPTSLNDSSFRPCLTISNSVAPSSILILSSSALISNSWVAVTEISLISSYLEATSLLINSESKNCFSSIGNSSSMLRRTRISFQWIYSSLSLPRASTMGIVSLKSSTNSLSF